MTRFALATLLLLAAPAAGAEAPASDPEAVAVARRVLERLGGEEAWRGTRHVAWRFMGRRDLAWDRWTDDFRLDADDLTVLMNLRTRQGRAWRAGRPLAGDELGEALTAGHAAWVNDSYWMFMPYKLLDPGVRLRYLGPRPLPDGRPAEVLELTFDGVGLTPENRYEVWVGTATSLVEQWSFYRTAADAEPMFTLPWADWRRFGRIWLATDHGRSADWNIRVSDEVPASFHAEP